MTLEQTLTAELDAVASSVQAPPPPAIADLVQQAGAERRRGLLRRGATVGLAAAVVLAAILLGTQIGRPNATPPPVKPSPSYYAPGVPYLFDQGLYVGHVRQPGTWYYVESYGRSTVALATDQTVTVFRDGRPVMHVNGLVQIPSLSFDGSKAAWIVTDSHAAGGALVVRDLEQSRDLVRLPLTFADPRGGGASGFSLSVLNDGSAYYEVDGRQWTWWPGAAHPVPTDQMPSSQPDHPEGFSDVTASVRLSPDHLWGAWITDPSGHELQDVAGAALGVTVQKPGEPASRFTIPVPPGADVSALAFWMSPTTVNLVGDRQVACDIVVRRCRTLDGP